MATFAVGQSIKTREPVIVVDAGLKPGSHRFQLEVVTSDGRTSKADGATVTVTDGTVTPVLDPRIRDTITSPILDPRIVIDRIPR